MFLTCFRVPRPIGTRPGNILVFGVYRSVALAIENALAEITRCMHDKIGREWDEGVGETFFGICAIILRCL